jgi:hypothetical protein
MKQTILEGGNRLRVLPVPLRHSGVDIFIPQLERQKKEYDTHAMRFYWDYIAIKRSLSKAISGDSPWQQEKHIL